MSDLFSDRSLKPMLIGADADPFDDPSYLYEMKWDGERCLAYLDPEEGVELRNKRGDRMLPKVPELGRLHHQITKRCILDGELVMLTDGKPDFASIQRRSLMSNRFKIELDARQHPASYVAFDLLYCDGQPIMGLPLEKRKEMLASLVMENDRVAVSRVIGGVGTAFFQLAREQELEGIVAKHRDSLYRPGQRTKEWIKIKNLQDDDFIVCGYIVKPDHHMVSIVVGQYDAQRRLVYRGHVTLGVGGDSFRLIQAQTKRTASPFDDAVPSGHGNSNAVWIEPVLVCTVKYMQKTAAGGLRQPVFKGLREDKLPTDCRIS